MQPLGDSSALPGDSDAAAAAAAAAAESGSRGVLGAGDRQQELGLDSLKLPSQAVALPSAEAVWSPILALRTFVEPLTSRASAAFRNFQISFHDPEGEAAGGGVVATASGRLAGAAAPTTTTTGDGEGKGGGTAMDGEERREERPAPPGAIGAVTTASAAAAADADAANADADAPKEELREASAGQFWHEGSGVMELSVGSIGHDRAGGDEEKERTGAVEMKDDGDGDASRVAV